MFDDRRSCLLTGRPPQLFVLLAALAIPAALPAQADSTGPDPIAQLVARLDLERYKATIKGLTNFGDRRQGTDRNRAAVDWIEAQLRSYGCGDVARLKYEYQPPGSPSPDGRGGQGVRTSASGGGRYRGIRARTGVNNDSLKQPDARVRALDAQASTPGAREEVYCTKIGDTHPGEMYIVGGHMDGIGWGEAANDDGSGAALVMELARVFSGPDVHTDRSIRFILWNNEETGLNGSRAYVEQRRALQGTKDEPKWLGMIQHDMMLFDHGMPRADGTLSPEQRPEADVNIEFQSSAKFAGEAQELAWAFERANEKYATDYPASVGSHMTNTDSAPFQDYVAAISLRENERGTQIGAGWDPNWHQPTDLYATYSDKDFRLGLNAAQTTLAALAGLVGATIK
ncbi:MAG: peptidase M28 [Gemmatimonadetes bacterium]|nr:MAG: peptidase M28 [Gemmatimonadota bacterium]